LSYLQTLSNFVSQNDQKSFAASIQSDSSLIQEKIFVNMIKLPIVMKIIPLTSEVKFDIVKGSFKMIMNRFNDPRQIPIPSKEDSGSSPSKDPKDSKVFLYNPWERDDTINYYWTANSYQKVYIQFYNPLSLELKINKIVLLFEGNKPFSFPSNF
jgi:hypothetical protein